MDRIEYYKNSKILFELIKQCASREIVFLQKAEHENYDRFCIRQINARSINVLQSNFDRFDFFEMPLNIYYSLAKYKYIPFASFNMAERRDQYKEWAEDWRNQFLAIDFGFDFDGKDLKEVWRYAKVLKDFLDKHQQPYRISFSGNKGFHIEIPQENLPKFSNYDQCLTVWQYVTEGIKSKLGLKSINDDGFFDDTIADLKRIFKLKYSWDVSSGFICLPLDDAQFNNFSTDLCKPENVIKLSWLGRRGLLTRNSNKMFNPNLF